METTLSVHQWMIKENMVYRYYGTLFSLKKNKEIQPFLTTWMNLEDSMVSKVSQTKKNTVFVGVEKWEEVGKIEHTFSCKMHQL